MHTSMLCLHARVRLLTHDGDVVLDEEESLVAALHDQGQSVSMFLSVQSNSVHTQHTIAWTQGSLPDRQTDRSRDI